ncbi:TPA: hypothetical protein ACNBWM_004488 [Escherichia coli]|nr:hypothetical protein [Escherichia coli]
MTFQEHQLAVQQEIEWLDKQLDQLDRSQLKMPQLVPHPRHEIVWRIPVPNHPDVFMTASNAANYEFIVYVNGLAFYRAWLMLGVRHYQGCPLRKDMPKDRNYYAAVDGFEGATDKNNPVPLAEPVPTTIEGNFAIGFANGMTRSMWLLAHEVAVFPVYVGSEASAVMLAQHVGIAPPIKVSELREQCRSKA